ncbi:MAG: response regulator [Desulfobulbaceae bacterium]|nr:response regulator [Desulfobulbaceae bacterium]
MKNPRILLVEDEALLRLSLEINLKRKGLSVETAEAGGMALTALKKQPYDLLISDYIMEGMTGIELMKQARSTYPQLKVIIMTGYADLAEKEKIMQAGADGFLYKPISLDNLLETISEM